MTTRVQKDMDRLRNSKADTRTGKERQADIVTERMLDLTKADAAIKDPNAKLRRAGELLGAIGGSSHIEEQIVNNWKRRVNLLLGVKVFDLELDRN